VGQVPHRERGVGDLADALGQIADHRLVLLRRAALPLVLEAGQLRLEVVRLVVQALAGRVPDVGGVADGLRVAGEQHGVELFVAVLAEVRVWAHVHV